MLDIVQKIFYLLLVYVDVDKSEIIIINVIKCFFIEKLQETAQTILSKPISSYCGHDRFWKHLKDAAEYLLS